MEISPGWNKHLDWWARASWTICSTTYLDAATTQEEGMISTGASSKGEEDW